MFTLFVKLVFGDMGIALNLLGVINIKAHVFVEFIDSTFAIDTIILCNNQEISKLICCSLSIKNCCQTRVSCPFWETGWGLGVLGRAPTWVGGCAQCCCTVFLHLCCSVGGNSFKLMPDRRHCLVAKNKHASSDCFKCTVAELGVSYPSKQM